MRRFLPFFICLLAISGIQAQTTAPLPGDPNGNGRVSIADVVTLVNYILGNPYAYFDYQNADVNNDKAITVSDIAATVDIVLNAWEYREEGQEITKISDRLVADNFDPGAGEVTLNVVLDDSKTYTSLQAEVEIPEGMIIEDVRVGRRATSHQLLYNITEEGNLKLILMSFKNLPFPNEKGDPLFIIKARVEGGCGSLTMKNIIAANTDGNNYELGFSGGIPENYTTGAGAVNSNDIRISIVNEGVEVVNAYGKVINVYTVNGELFKTVTAASNYEKIRLQKGVYIITVGNKSVKVIL